MGAARTLITIAIVLLMANSFAGSVHPPSPPAPTMRPLEEIETRTAITVLNTPGDSDSLYRITKSGSYYLVGNVAGVPGKHGIEIAASGVTVDLMGFAMEGVAGSLGGIVTDGIRDNLVVRNGVVRTWDYSGINLVRGGTGKGSVIEGVRTIGNMGYGIRTNESSIVRDCIALSQVGLPEAPPNNGTGIYADAGSVVSGCFASNNVGSGIAIGTNSRVEACVSYDNGGMGVRSYYNANISECVSVSNNDGIGTEYGCRVSECVTGVNSRHGYASFENTGGGARVSDLLAVGNGSVGIFPDVDCVVEGSVSIGNDFGIATYDFDSVIQGNHLYTYQTGNSQSRNLYIVLGDNVIIGNTIAGYPSRVQAGNACVIWDTPYGDAVIGDSGGTLVNASACIGNWGY